VIVQVYASGRFKRESIRSRASFRASPQSGWRWRGFASTCSRASGSFATALIVAYAN
jgi:hypothetical protein